MLENVNKSRTSSTVLASDSNTSVRLMALNVSIVQHNSATQLSVKQTQFKNKTTSPIRGGAPIGARGHDPPLLEAKVTGGHNLGIIRISHIALITPLH